MAGPTEEDALKDSREGTRKTNSCDSRGGTETPVSHPSFGRRLNLWAPFSLTDVAEKGDEGSGSLCPKGSSALDKQTQSPFLQGQGTRGTVKTCRHRVSARPAPVGVCHGLPGGRATRARDPRRSALCTLLEGAPSTLLRGMSTPGWSAMPAWAAWS